jgi:cation diffusion facilitator CzcD-associated flavoprotein CzcO
MSTEVHDVIVVGGGQAGLAMAWHLKRQGRRFLVLDAGPQIGHTWRSRWDSLVLFTPAQYDALPGMAFPAPADTYPTKEQVAGYLQAYTAGTTCRSGSTARSPGWAGPGACSRSAPPPKRSTPARW